MLTNMIWLIPFVLVLVYALDPPPNATVGAQFPMHKTSRFNFVEDGGGRRRRAAFLLALNHINNKNDGFWDDLLPNTTLKYAMYDSKRDEGVAVINAFYMWSEAKAVVAIGPASSSPTKMSQNVFKVNHINIPQVSYSATSSQLSEASSYPRFMRTPPSDLYQAEIMVSTIKLQGYNKVCMIAGTDAYSQGGANAIVEEVNQIENIILLSHVLFENNVDSVQEQIKQLVDTGCPIVVVWSQAGDMRTIVLEADKQGLSADNEKFPVLWVTSEMVLGSLEDICKGIGNTCKRVLRGAICVTPNYGPGTASYQKIADAWHAQTTHIGKTNGDRTSNDGYCDDTKDYLGRNVWLVNHDQDTSTPDKCAAVDFNDYSTQEATTYVAESMGDGRISMYVPFAYDSLVMVAYGLHSLYSSDKWKDATSQTERKLLYDGTKIYKHLLKASFDGFSGQVSFRCSLEQSCTDIPFDNIIGGKNKFEGDRMASSIGFFVWNYDGTKFSKIGLTKKAGIHIPTDKEKYGTACLIGVSHNAPMVWPAINGHPHDESNWDFFYCPEGKVYNSIQNKCLSCAPTTFALNKDTCSICPLGKTTHENHKAMSPLDCVDCSVGKKGLGTGGCELCTSGKYNDKTGAISCKFCSLGSDTGNLFGMFSCSKCSVGRYGQTLGSCTDCLPGFYSEELGNIACNECPKDTFNYVFGAANVAMCLSCPEDRSTNGATGQRV